MQPVLDFDNQDDYEQTMDHVNLVNCLYVLILLLLKNVFVVMLEYFYDFLYVLIKFYQQQQQLQ